MSNNIDDIFHEANVFDLNLLKKDYFDSLNKPYDTAIVIGRMKYEGEVKEIQNNEFGYFKFLGIYPEI